MAIPISRFASVTGDIAKAKGDGKAFSSPPGQCEELERRSGSTFRKAITDQDGQDNAGAENWLRSSPHAG
ncbi:hypothetical protein HFN07_15280 [Rhizobium leguminosarum]|nr:hypothetical protein [Rhizobium leguminosarum]